MRRDARSQEAGELVLRWTWPHDRAACFDCRNGAGHGRFERVRRYGEWAGNEAGVPEDTARCVEKVWPTYQFSDKQCSRKRGHGPKGLYCKQHSKTIAPPPPSQPRKVSE